MDTYTTPRTPENSRTRQSILATLGGAPVKCRRFHPTLVDCKYLVYATDMAGGSVTVLRERACQAYRYVLEDGVMLYQSKGRQVFTIATKHDSSFLDKLPNLREVIIVGGVANAKLLP